MIEGQGTIKATRVTSSANQSFTGWIRHKEQVIQVSKNLQWLALIGFILFLLGGPLFNYPDGATATAIFILFAVLCAFGLQRKYWQTKVRQRRELKVEGLRGRFLALEFGEQFNEPDIDLQTVDMFEEWLNSHFPMDAFQLDYPGKGLSSHIEQGSSPADFTLWVKRGPLT